MMAGGSNEHAQIVENAFFQLRSNQGSCRVRSSELAVSVANLNRYFFPDVSAVCNENENLEQHNGIACLTNPALIVEVLSESTTDYDRSDKFHSYRQLPSFREYVLINSQKLSVETFYQETEDLWHIRSYFKRGQRVEFRTLGVSILIDDLYDGVELDAPIA